MEESSKMFRSSRYFIRLRRHARRPGFCPSSRCGPNATPGAPHAAHPRSPHARLCHGQRVTRRRNRARQCRRKLHPRPYPQPRAGNGRAGRRAAGRRSSPSPWNRPTARSIPASRASRIPLARPDPTDPAKLIVTTSHPAPYTRRVAVYVPKQYVPGTAAPFIVGADGPDRLLFTALDNLIAEHECR